MPSIGIGIPGERADLHLDNVALVTISPRRDLLLFLSATTESQ